MLVLQNCCPLLSTKYSKIIENMMEVADTVSAKEPEVIDGDEEIDELSTTFALIEASLQDQVY